MGHISTAQQIRKLRYSGLAAAGKCTGMLTEEYSIHTAAVLGIPPLPLYEL